jgi:hypothetical protein
MQPSSGKHGGQMVGFCHCQGIAHNKRVTITGKEQDSTSNAFSQTLSQPAISETLWLQVVDAQT